MSINKVILVGRAGKDPEVKTLTGGKKVASFTLATNDYKDAQGNQKVSWHNITVWETLANTAEQYLKKGQELYVEGRISYEQYTDKETGVVKNYTRITADKFQFIGSKKDNADNGSADSTVNEASAPAQSAPAKTPAKAPAKAPVKASTPAPAPAPAMVDTDDSENDLPF